MPLYFFNFSNGKGTFADNVGTELAGLTDARELGIKKMRDMKTGQAERETRAWSAWKMIVVDAKGESVYEIGFDLVPKAL